MEPHDEEVEFLAKTAIDCAFRIHTEIGPGLLESAYETFLVAALQDEGLSVEAQKAISVSYRGRTVKNALRLDLLINGQLIIEIKSLERLVPVHHKQLLTYLRVTNLPLGLLINFGSERLKDGLRRVINDRHSHIGAFGIQSAGKR
jgi:GxxExxY protein